MKSALGYRYVFYFCFFFSIDRITKYLALHFLKNEIINLGILDLRLVRNTGTIFGIGKRIPLAWLIFSIFIFGIIFVFFIKKFYSLDKIIRLNLLFILTGALSNIIDRIIYGAVIDFIDFRFWPVFNFSDAYISVGTIILMYKLWKQDHLK